MARRRRPPSTPFGAWLAAWLDGHAEWTLDALAADIGTTNSAISQWLSGDTKRVKVEYLHELARVTGEPFANLEQLVYPGRLRPAEQGTISPELLDAIEERMRRAFREELRSALAELRGEGPSGSSGAPGAAA